MTNDRNDERLRTRRRLAREYRRRGYQVIEQPRGEALPPFLRGFSPDLVVTKDDDRAVVEVRTRESLIGSNAFVELAKAVEAHPEWRLELVSLGTSKRKSMEVSEDDLERLLAAGLGAAESGQRAFALIYLVSVLDELVRDLAMQHHVGAADRIVPAIVDELAFQGIIAEGTADLLDWAWNRRSAMLHGAADAASPSEEQIARLIAACRELHVAARLEAA